MNVIINGPGRSGTTLFSEMFCYHEDFAWISGWVNLFPAYPSLSYFNHLYRRDFLGLHFDQIKKNAQA